MALNQENIAAVTICSKNYFSKALTLRESYLAHHPDSVFYILVVDKFDAEFDAEFKDLNLYWVENLGIKNLYQYAFKYDVIEFNTMVKASILKVLIRKHSKVIYLDPDIFVYRELQPVFEALKENSIVITPHTTTPVLDGALPGDCDFLRFGAYNLGFLAVADSKDSIEFLDWFEARLLDYNYYETPIGLAVDQKWIDLAPSFFDGICINKCLGLNVAFWNLHERSLAKKGEDWYVNDKTPLYFFHFSSFNFEDPECIANKQTRFKKGDCANMRELFYDYKAALEKQQVPDTDGNYTFDYFDDGVYITPTMRKFYAGLIDCFEDDEDIFSSKSKVRKFGERAGLVSKRIVKAKSYGFQELSKHQKKLNFIYFGLKIALKVLGPERYFMLMRLLPRISIVREHAHILKKYIK